MRKMRTIIAVLLGLLALNWAGYLLLSRLGKLFYVDGLEFLLRATCALACGVAARQSHRLTRSVWILTGLFFFILGVGDLQDFYSWFFPHSALVSSAVLSF